MPQWGIAMVAAGDWRPRFQIDLLVQVNGNPVPPSMVRARAAARKAVELAKAPGAATPLEKLYIDAIAARRNPDSKNPEEDFVKGLRAVVAKYPDDIEGQLDLSLMVMRGFSTPDKKPLAPGTTEAVQILQGPSGESSGTPRCPPLRHPCLGRLPVREGCVAKLREIRRARDEHSSCHSHAWTYLFADGPLG